jgi:hypothetical protein
MDMFIGNTFTVDWNDSCKGNKVMALIESHGWKTCLDKTWKSQDLSGVLS